MKGLRSALLWGGLLVVVGVLFLLQNLGMFELSGLVLAVIFGVVGIFFLTMFFQAPKSWWWLFPGLILLAAGVILLLGELVPQLEGALSGLIVLGAIGLAFLGVYLANREFWWAIIPAGVMLTLAVVTLVNDLYWGIDSGGVLFLGFALTFAVLALISVKGVRMRWAWIPAGVLALLGLFLLFQGTNLLMILISLALLAAGIFLIFKAVGGK